MQVDAENLSPTISFYSLFQKYKFKKANFASIIFGNVKDSKWKFYGLNVSYVLVNREKFSLVETKFIILFIYMHAWKGCMGMHACMHVRGNEEKFSSLFKCCSSTWVYFATLLRKLERKLMHFIIMCKLNFHELFWMHPIFLFILWNFMQEF